MKIQNTSTTKTIYVSLSNVGETPKESVVMGPNGVKNYNSQVGVMKLNIGGNKDSSLWSGVVPTQIKEPLMIGFGTEPYVTYSGQLIPNTLQSGGNPSLILLLVFLLVIIVIIAWLYNRKS